MSIWKPNGNNGWKPLWEARKRLQTAQPRKTRNYVKRVRRDAEDILPDHNVFLRVEKRDDKESDVKLGHTGEGSFNAKSVETYLKNFVIIQPDNSVEKAPTSRLFWAPDEPKADDLRQETRPMTITEIVSDFHAA